MSTLSAVEGKGNILKENDETYAGKYDQLDQMVTVILNNFGKNLYGKSLFFSKNYYIYKLPKYSAWSLKPSIKVNGHMPPHVVVYLKYSNGGWYFEIDNGKPLHSQSQDISKENLAYGKEPIRQIFPYFIRRSVLYVNRK